MPYGTDIFACRGRTHSDGELAQPECELVHQLDVGDGDRHGSGGDLGAPIDGEDVADSQWHPESIRSRRRNSLCDVRGHRREAHDSESVFPDRNLVCLYFNGKLVRTGSRGWDDRVWRTGPRSAWPAGGDSPVVAPCQRRSEHDPGDGAVLHGLVAVLD